MVLKEGDKGGTGGGRMGGCEKLRGLKCGWVEGKRSETSVWGSRKGEGDKFLDEDRRK